MQRYGTWGEVIEYCVYSANPVGRLVLYLCGYVDEERQQAFRISLARLCSLRISGRMFRATLKRADLHSARRAGSARADGSGYCRAAV